MLYIHPQGSWQTSMALDGFPQKYILREEWKAHGLSGKQSQKTLVWERGSETGKGKGQIRSVMHRLIWTSGAQSHWDWEPAQSRSRLKGEEGRTTPVSGWGILSWVGTSLHFLTQEGQLLQVPAVETVSTQWM